MDPFSIAMLAIAAIPKLIDGFELLFSNKKKAGPKKKKLLMDSTKAGLTIAKVPTDKQALILNAVSSLTDMAVKELNSAKPKTAKK